MAETTTTVCKIGDIAAQLSTAARLVLITDFFWVYTADGTQVKIPAEWVRKYLTANIQPEVGADGNWTIGGVDTGVKAEGVTPQLRGGTEGIEVSYDKGATWTMAVLYSQMDVDLEGLKAAYKQVTESEEARVAAEKTRVSQESARVTAEKARADAETKRASAETSRASAEKDRASAETTRQTNETARKNQESARETAEAKRESDCAAAVANANDTAEHPTKVGTDNYVYTWDKTAQQYVKTSIYVKGDMGELNTFDITTLTPTSTFAKNVIVGINGTLYRSTKATSSLPITLVVENGQFVTETVDGKTAYVVSSETVNDGWEQLTDKAVEYWIASLNALLNDLNASLSGKAGKATTLAGYGITDAKIANGVITLGSSSITPITSHQSLSGYAKTTDIPTKTSQLTNDSGYLTSHQDISGKADVADLTSHTGDTSNPHSVTKAQVGLGNVDNTSDASKPISTATQSALDLKLSTADASNTYLAKADASSTYLAKTDASSTYLSKTDASSTYQPKGDYLTPTDQYTAGGVTYSASDLLQAVANLMAKTIVTTD